MMQTQFQVLVKEMHADLNKIGCAYSIDRAELESELWLYSASQTGKIDPKAAGRHLVSRAIELSRSNGVSSARAVSFDDTECTLADHFVATDLDPLAILLAVEADAERDKRIASLDSLTKARLSAVECSRSAAEMGRSLGLKGRKARHVLSAWVAEASAAQTQLF
jgi:hypothetical protein